MSVQEPLAATDPLGEALHLLRLSGSFYCRSELTAPWGLALPPFAGYMWFHIVTAGRCWIAVGGAEPRLVQPGDLSLVPHGEGHDLLSDPQAQAVPIQEVERELVSDRYELMSHGGGGQATTLICGAVRLDHPAAYNLIALLPKVLHIASSDMLQDWTQSTLRMMMAEARVLRPGGETIITRLADILVIQTIRSWIEHDPAAQNGWLGALRDRQIGRAIALIHQQPAVPWTVSSLADEVAMSRSAFAARFNELVGEPPMRYVGRWRMYLALDWLRNDELTLGEVATRLGYGSEAAFSRAFKRVIGVSPGAVRRSHQQLLDDLHVTVQNI